MPSCVIIPIPTDSDQLSQVYGSSAAATANCGRRGAHPGVDIGAERLERPHRHQCDQSNEESILDH